MGVGRQTATRLQFAPEVIQVLFGQPALQKRAGVHAGRGVPLEVNQIAVVTAFAAAAQEMIEGNFVQRRGRSESGDVPADTVELLVGPHDHRHGIPADDALDAPFQLTVTRIRRLLLHGNRVDVGRIRSHRKIDARQSRFLL